MRMNAYRKAALVAGTLAFSAVAQAHEADSSGTVPFDITAPSMVQALIQFTEQSGLQLMVPTDGATDMPARRVNGRYTPTAALDRLLAGTRLKYEFANSRTVAIRTSDSSGRRRPAESSSSGSKAPATRDNEAIETSGIEKAGPNKPEANAVQSADIDEVVVTGSHIAGGSVASPVFVFTEEDWSRAGATTAQQFVATLPQQFGSRSSLTGGISPLAGSDPSYGAGVNLRGLGSGSTLVLVNGRRSAVAGNAEYVDISLIPLSAVERIEVLTDGASAVYGSDAVGGVVNFILKENFSGASTLAQFGQTSRGDGQEYRAAQMLGHGWTTGSVLLNYEYSRQDAVNSLDRQFSKAGLETELVSPRRTHSLYMSGRNRLFKDASVFADASYAERKFDLFSELDSVGDSASSGTSRNYGAAFGITVPLSGTWESEVVAGWSRYESDVDSVRFDPSFASTSSNTKSASSLQSFEATANGRLFQLPAGDARLALGLEFRDEKFDSRLGRNLSSGIGGNTYPRSSMVAKSAFFEISAPLIGRTDRSQPTIALTLAGRYDDYTRFGDAFSPKVGLVWNATTNIKVRTTHEDSFKVPSVFQLTPANASISLVSFMDSASQTGSTRAMTLSGNNPELQPETAETWTIGTDLKFLPGGGLVVSATYFDTRYVDRIQSNPRANLIDPDYAELVLRRGELSDAEFNSIVSHRLDGSVRITNCPAAFRDLSTGACLENPGSFGAIIDRRLMNVAALKTSGVDLAFTQKIKTSIGDFRFELSGTKVLQYDTQFTSAATEVERLDIAGNPVNLRSRGGVVWVRGGWSAGTYVNYIDGYINNLVVPETDVASWTTVDGSVGYESTSTHGGGGGGGGGLGGLAISVNVLNLFDAGPPFFAYGASFPNIQIGYDPINADPLGRRFLVTGRRSW